MPSAQCPSVLLPQPPPPLTALRNSYTAPYLILPVFTNPKKDSQILYNSAKGRCIKTCFISDLFKDDISVHSDVIQCD